MNQRITIGRQDFSASQQRLATTVRRAGSGDRIAEDESAYVLVIDHSGKSVCGLVLGVSSVMPRGMVAAGDDEPYLTFQAMDDHEGVVASPDKGQGILLRTDGSEGRLDGYPFVFRAFKSSQAAITWYDSRHDDDISVSHQFFGPGIPQNVRYDW